MIAPAWDKLRIGLIVVLLGVLCWRAWPNIRAHIPDDFQKLSGPERVQRARATHEAAIREKYRAAHVNYPGEVFVRWLKHEASLELWARNGTEAFRLVAAWPILASSGKPGPKRRQGDYQVPEGFYEIDRFHRDSLFHLSLGLNYPKESDRLLSDPKAPGGDIFIHGKDGSVGCAPIGDEAIEELYLAALDARTAGQQRFAVHIFPARMTGAEWDTFAAPYCNGRPELIQFWETLRPAYEAFERTRQLPQVRVDPDGAYRLANP
jgi:murein L,D-transpeptidase YafK